MIYLDFAATTPMLPQAIEAYAQAATQLYGNSASLHDAGGAASAYVEAVRRQLAMKLQVSVDGITFTGSGTEANALAICALALSQKKRHIITSYAEHTSVQAAMHYLQQHGFTIERLPFTEQGVVDVAQVEAAITPNTALISVQHVNSEIGTIQPVAQLAALAKKYDVLYHVDCVQSFCKIDVPSDVDAITVSAHKIGGPRGVGAMYINPRRRTVPLFPGMTHERGLRGGTQDVPSIVAFGAAMAYYTYDLDVQWALRRTLQETLSSHVTWIEGPRKHQLPSIVGVCIEGIEGQLAMLQCNAAQIAISTGSACDITSASGTKAIIAMGKTFDEARQFCRISMGMTTCHEHIIACSDALNSLIRSRHAVQ